MYRDFYKALILSPNGRHVSLMWPNVVDWFLKFFCIALFVTVSVLTCKEIWRFENRWLYVLGSMFGLLGLAWLYVTHRGYVHSRLHARVGEVSTAQWNVLWYVLFILFSTGATSAILWGVIEKSGLNNTWKIAIPTFIVFVVLVVNMCVRRLGQ